MSETELRDHAQEMLTAVVEDIGTKRRLERNSPTSRRATAPLAQWK